MLKNKYLYRFILLILLLIYKNNYVIESNKVLNNTTNTYLFKNKTRLFLSSASIFTGVSLLIFLASKNHFEKNKPFILSLSSGSLCGISIFLYGKKINNKYYKESLENLNNNITQSFGVKEEESEASEEKQEKDQVESQEEFKEKQFIYEYEEEKSQASEEKQENTRKRNPRKNLKKNNLKKNL